MATTYTNAHSHTGNSPSPCGCKDTGATSPHTCCDLVCFERPRYFCGHLLTDDDLSLEQSYLVEKNRLRNRALHGHGIVCGLRLTCDPNCSGHVAIGNGYALDACGNDLVVCSPYSFNVIAELKKKHWIPTVSKDPYVKDRDDNDCPVKQCFYIAACYTEEEAEYTTPFVAGCNSTPASCEPTRILEKVRFEVLEHAPEKPAYLDLYEEHVRNTWKPFTEGHFAKILTTQFNASANDEGHNDRFCQLRVLFLEQIRRCPPRQTCSLERRVRELECPKDMPGNVQPAAAYEALLKLVHEYVYDGILNGLAFECPCYPKAGCVVVGKVEVENGKILRVCNCGRDYVWSFANFHEVLASTILEARLCKPGKSIANRAGAADSCCPDIEIDLNRFSTFYRRDPHTAQYTAQAYPQAVRTFVAATNASFAPADPTLFAAQSFHGVPIEQAQELAKQIGLNMTSLHIDQAPADMLSAIRAGVLLQAGEHVVAFTDQKNQIVSMLPISSIPTSVDDAARATATEAQTNVAALQKSVADLQWIHGELTAKVEDMRKTLDSLTNKNPGGAEHQG